MTTPRPDTCVVALFVTALLLLAGAAEPRANGWEHHAIPLPALLQALDGEDDELKARAALSLGIRQEPRAVEPLLALADRAGTGPRLRGVVYEALGRIGDARAAPRLVRALVEEEREELRADAAAALGGIAAPDSMAALVAALRDASISVRARAVAALGHFGAPAVAALAVLVREDRGLRLRAVDALGRTGASEAAVPLLDALAAAGGAVEEGAIVDALGHLAAAEAHEPLARLLRSSDDPELRLRVAAALGRIRDGSVVPTLVGMLRSEPPAAQHYALVGLMELDDKAAAGPIADHSAGILDRLAGRSTESLLARPEESLVDYGLLLDGLRALVELDAKLGLPVFLAAAAPREVPRDSAAALKLAEAVYETRRLAIVGLGYTGSAEAAAFLAGPFADPDPRLRAAAARSVAVLGMPDAAPVILPLLADADGEVRVAAAAALGRLADRRAVAPLARGLSDREARVRREAALSLGYLGDEAARPALLALSESDADAGVRAAARASALLLAEVR